MMMLEQSKKGNVTEKKHYFSRRMRKQKNTLKLLSHLMLALYLFVFVGSVYLHDHHSERGVNESSVQTDHSCKLCKVSPSKLFIGTSAYTTPVQYQKLVVVNEPLTSILHTWKDIPLNKAPPIIT